MNAVAKAQAPAPGDSVTPPIALEAEQAVLGGLILDSKAYWEIAAFLRPEHFFEACHAHIFRAIGELLSTGREVGIATLAHVIDIDHTLADIGGRRYLLVMAQAAMGSPGPTVYARLVRDYAARRAMIYAAKDMIAQAEKTDVDIDVIAGSMRAQIDDIEQVQHPGVHVRSIGEAAALALEQVKEAEERKGIAGVTYGLGKMDRMTGGMMPGELIVLAGRPGMGKSAAAENVALGAALSGKGVLVISQEMKAEQLALRAMSSIGQATGTPFVYSDLRKGVAPPFEMEAAHLAYEQVRNLPVRIVDGRSLTVAKVRAEAIQADRYFRERGSKFDLVIIDHLQLLEASRRYDNRVAEITEITKAVKALAGDLDAPVLLLSQLSRAVEMRPDKRPILSDLRDSGSIEQDADTVWLFFRQEYYEIKKKPDQWKDPGKYNDWKIEFSKIQGNLEAHCAKQRCGPEDTVHLWCDLARNAIRDDRPSHQAEFGE